MNRLIKKYKDDSLTLSELHQFREKISSGDTTELEQELWKDWISGQTEEPKESQEADYSRIWGRIEQDMHESKPTASFSWARIWQYAAALLLPILLLSTFYFYREASVMGKQETAIETKEGERANIILPDGTSVYMNSVSRLAYNPVEFNRKSRSVDFEGEAYFQVTPNQELPFTISAQKMQLKVLGTEFNLKSRKSQDSIVITLKKGHVLLSAATKQQELFENETAIFNKKTGTFSVEKEQDVTIHWMQKELLFKNTPLSDLLKIIEEKYSISIEWTGGEQLMNDKFSGILPSDNLVAVLEILCKSYQCSYIVRANQVIITFSPK